MPNIGSWVDWHHRIRVCQNLVVQMSAAEASEGKQKRDKRHKPRQAALRSTDIGYLNKNEQEVLSRTDCPGTDHGQRVYMLRCRKCGAQYGANGTDIWIRKCPVCQGGKPGL